LAARFQLTGFVRNLPDGRVCLVVEGEKSQIEGLLGEIQAEMNPYIGNVQKMERPATGQFQSFEIRH
jgi:acylphosphatase